MAKIEQMLRLKYIEEFLRRRKLSGASYQEITNYLEEKLEDRELKFTERTFQRDKKAILDIFKVEILYSRSKSVYFIKEEDFEENQENVFDQLLLVEAYRETKDHSEIMFFEPRRARGLEHLNGIIHAITNKKIITFQYKKFWEDVAFNKVVCPYALKECKNRWYLLATDFQPKDSQFFMKTYGLDRIYELDIKSSSFKKEKYDAKEAFENSFGIISPNKQEPKEILLEYDFEQANYVKALPLHHSQKIVSENKNSTVFSVFLVPTYDFQREILSYGERVKILSPESFKNEMKAIIQLMLKNF
jgi:predicted DNA-binding transcriptional regulator YafY